MTWLNGRPSRQRVLCWPMDDPELDEATKYKGLIYRRDGTSVFNDLIVHFIALCLPNHQPKTLVYLADLKNDNADSVQFERIATIPVGVQTIALLASSHLGALYATATFHREDSLVYLRTHARNGVTLQSQKIPARAAYGQLVVSGSSVAICISSDQLSPDIPDCLIGDPYTAHRIDYISGHDFHLPRDLVGDQIAIWNTQQDEVRMVVIPQDKRAPMQHDADFQFIESGKVALAGDVSSSYGRPSGLLKIFSSERKENYARTFAAGESTSPDCILKSVSSPGSSAHSDIFVHYHSRITVFQLDLLTGQIPSEPNSYDPSGLHSSDSHHSHTRTLEYGVGRFPSLSGNRILVYEQLDEGIVFKFLDFDHDRVNRLVRLQPSEREDLYADLTKDHARVKVVTRRFFVDSVGEEEDGEYPWPTPSPSAWQEHLQNLYLQGEAVREGTQEALALEYDEAPMEHRDQVLFPYVETVVQLPEQITGARAMTLPNELALTLSSVVELSGPGENGWIYDFTA